METFKSDISGKVFPVKYKVYASTIRNSIFNIIKDEHPTFDKNCLLSVDELNGFREKYITKYLSKEVGELNNLEQTVLNSLRNKETLVDKIEDEPVNLTFGQHVADKVASFGGSWSFIILFGVFILLWILLNVIIFVNRGFDPYPFILLNLILSCIAAIQAPVIMMSQNRQEEKDRDRSKKDYMINLKSELEIRMLHEKMDHLIMNQQQELIEIQKVQIEMMNDILRKLEK